MAYNKEKLFKTTLEAIEEQNCLFIEQLVSFLPCDKTTFYKHFPINSNKNNTIKEKLEDNKVSMKSKMYEKWFISDNPTLQVALMKLIGTDKEVDRLNGVRKDSAATIEERDKEDARRVVALFPTMEEMQEVLDEDEKSKTDMMRERTANNKH